jgi:hypothetical protein
VIFGQLTLNATARAVAGKPTFSHVYPVIERLQWLKLNERIQFKIFSLTYKVLRTYQPVSLCDLLSIQPASITRSSAVAILCFVLLLLLSITMFLSYGIL